MKKSSSFHIPIIKIANSSRDELYKSKDFFNEIILGLFSGSGGVGYAAIRICQSMDCDIFTTVGSEEKKQFLLKEFPQLKQSQIFNSRDNKFEADILKMTDGYGVDLILNSLSGEKLFSSVKCLARNGRFCEIGKYDMMINSDLGIFSKLL